MSTLVIVNPSYGLADEIVVSGNGEGSTNNVNVSSNNTSSTDQTNTAQVNNNVEINAITGNNSANENNGGETNITTGDINASSEIENEGINQNSVQTDCCEDELALVIKNNGSDSNNSIDYSASSNTNVSINNTANIDNKVDGKANTGYNQANSNNGNVSIKSGDIVVIDSIKNESINNYAVKIANNSGGSVYISIQDNGTNSDNVVILSNTNGIQVDVENKANIENKSEWDLNTGGNQANSNNGDVSIETGDIYFASSIENGPINYGWVDVECCDQDKDEGGDPPDGTPPPPSGQPSNPSSSSSSPGSSSSGGTSVSQGQVLPVTGSPSLLFLVIGSVIMFFLGWYLRLRSGRSPNYLFAR